MFVLQNRKSPPDVPTTTGVEGITDATREHARRPYTKEQSDPQSRRFQPRPNERTRPNDTDAMDPARLIDRDHARTDRSVVENMADTLASMVGMGLSVGQIETMLSGLGLDLETVRGECGKFVGNASISLQRQTSIGLELLRDSSPGGDDDALVAQVVASLESELEDPPERFATRCPTR